MIHRHLLPDEFDLLLDDEVGFGVAPLREHARECASCRARLDDARVVVAALEELPRFAPSFTLADKIMAQVPVFVPWHVAARDTLACYVPQSRPARLVAAGLAAAGGATLTGATLWLAARGDLVGFATNIAGSHLRDAAAQAGRDGMVALFGSQLVTALQQGQLAGLGLIAGGFLLAAAASAFGLRAIASSARRRA